MFPGDGRTGQALLFHSSSVDPEASNRHEHGHGLPIFCFDITTAFLHAYLDPEEPPIFEWPPGEFLPGKRILWKLRRAVYGLRSAPRDWQDHFASEMQQNGIRRLKSGGHVYAHKGPFVVALARVDDLMTFGKGDDIKNVFGDIHERVLLNETWQLNNDGDKPRFLGRNVERCGNHLHLRRQGVLRTYPERTGGVVEERLKRQ